MAVSKIKLPKIMRGKYEETYEVEDCPVCGAKTEFDYSPFGGYFVFCKKSDTHNMARIGGVPKKTPQDAVEMWNRRARNGNDESD